MTKFAYLSPRRLSAFIATTASAGSCLAFSLSAQEPVPSPSPSASAMVTPVAAAVSPTAAPATAKEDLVGTIRLAGNFKTFLKAAEVAGLLATLQAAESHTVFAPTDTAFSKLPAGTLDDLLKPENKAKLVTLVSYHIAKGKLTSADLAKTEEIKTLEGTELDVDTNPDGKTIEVDEAKVLGTELTATNGVIHSIDTVLQP